MFLFVLPDIFFCLFIFYFSNIFVSRSVAASFSKHIFILKSVENCISFSYYWHRTGYTLCLAVQTHTRPLPGFSQPTPKSTSCFRPHCVRGRVKTTSEATERKQKRERKKKPTNKRWNGVDHSCQTPIITLFDLWTQSVKSVLTIKGDILKYKIIFKMSFWCVFLNDYDSVQSKTVSVMAAALFITLTCLLSSPCLIRLTGLTRCPHLVVGIFGLFCLQSCPRRLKQVRSHFSHFCFKPKYVFKKTNLLWWRDYCWVEGNKSWPDWNYWLQWT